mmetsp:Transcript_79015/g.245160  ORF Transcript_79015/g.245160 Transcript_79015/m.245160 type:complete len:272 (-) Transcript_79015:62-877(-)
MRQHAAHESLRDGQILLQHQLRLAQPCHTCNVLNGASQGADHVQPDPPGRRLVRAFGEQLQGLEEVRIHVRQQLVQIRVQSQLHVGLPRGIVRGSGDGALILGLRGDELVRRRATVHPLALHSLHHLVEASVVVGVSGVRALRRGQVNDLHRVPLPCLVDYRVEAIKAALVERAPLSLETFERGVCRRAPRSQVVLGHDVGGLDVFLLGTRGEHKRPAAGDGHHILHELGTTGRGRRLGLASGRDVPTPWHTGAGRVAIPAGGGATAPVGI